MKKLKNQAGFTLIEIIVVLIIVGILAAIALPNLFSNVTRSRAEEALGTISSFRPTIEGCIMKQAGALESTDCVSAVIGNPSASANFNYTLTGPATATGTEYKIVAAGNGGALAVGDTITMSRAAAAWANPPVFGAVTCVGAGQLQGTC